jgi:alanyl-tRNA synthetase
MGCDVKTVMAAIKPVQDLYIILDHTRTILITIMDGALPSNVGGGGNIRNILRRCFLIMNRHGWWDKIGMEGFL